MTFPRRYLPVMLGLALLILLGCKREDPVAVKPGPDPNNPPPKVQLPRLEETEPHAAGKKVYNTHGCARCHTMGQAQGGPPVPPLPGGKDGPPGKGGPPMPPGPQVPHKGPDLARAGARAGRDVEWFVTFVSNPMKQKPGAKMPPFEKQIKPEDLRALGEFLADLK